MLHPPAYACSGWHHELAKSPSVLLLHACRVRATQGHSIRLPNPLHEPVQAAEEVPLVLHATSEDRWGHTAGCQCRCVGREAASRPAGWPGWPHLSWREVCLGPRSAHAAPHCRQQVRVPSRRGLPSRRHAPARGQAHLAPPEDPPVSHSCCPAEDISSMAQGSRALRSMVSMPHLLTAERWRSSSLRPACPRPCPHLQLGQDPGQRGAAAHGPHPHPLRQASDASGCLLLLLLLTAASRGLCVANARAQVARRARVAHA